jgi:hypothetical protein
MTPVTSRYYGLPTATLTLADGRTVVYLTRRFVPAPIPDAVVYEYPLTPADRLDLIAYRFLGDPEQSWRLADANTAMNPADLIPLPADGLPTNMPQPRLNIPQPQAGV